MIDQRDDERGDRRDDKRREYGRDDRKDRDRERERDSRGPERARSPIPPPRTGESYINVQDSVHCLLTINVAPTAKPSSAFKSEAQLSPVPGLEPGEEGDTMEAVNDDDAAMMAMMGVAGFGSTKVRPSMILP